MRYYFFIKDSMKNLCIFTLCILCISCSATVDTTDETSPDNPPELKQEGLELDLVEVMEEVERIDENISLQKEG